MMLARTGANSLSTRKGSAAWEANIERRRPIEKRRRVFDARKGQKPRVRLKTAALGETLAAIAKSYGVHLSMVSRL